MAEGRMHAAGTNGSGAAHAATVVLVGHCGPDAAMLRGMVLRAVPGAQIERANSMEDLRALLPGASLLLVNRKLDGDFEVGSGTELMRGFLAGGMAGARWMLVSNFEDAQAEAIAAGANPGFGKTALYEQRTLSQVREAVG